MYWTSSSGRIELQITKSIANQCSHQGECDNDVNECLQIPSIKRQFDKLSNEIMALELREYGAWDENELKDIQANKQRILWIASGDIVDGNS